MTRNLLSAWADGWAAALDGMADYAAAALDRSLDPLAALEVVEWLNVMAARRRPTWSTPHEVVFETPIARLRDFSRGQRTDLVPTLVLPPQAGHDSCIVDFAPDQSQMGAILEAGLERALSLDWIGARTDTADTSIDDYLDVIDRAIDHCGGRVNLIGDCQGGWLAAIYAALNPERVNTLTLAGAPIDFHAGEPIIHELLRALSPGGDLSFYEALVAADGGVLRGEHMLAGFIAIQPATEISRQLGLLGHIGDARYVARYREFEDWFRHTQDIPGTFYLWIIRHLFRDNELIAGELEIGGRVVDLAALEMPLCLLGGSADHITPPGQVFAIADYASTPEQLVRRGVVPGGHLGLFMGHDALRNHWPAMLAAVLEHSRTAWRVARTA